MGQQCCGLRAREDTSFTATQASICIYSFIGSLARACIWERSDCNGADAKLSIPGAPCHTHRCRRLSYVLAESGGKKERGEERVSLRVVAFLQIAILICNKSG